MSEGGNAPGWPSAARAWATVFLLVACYATAFVDRQILALLVEPVSRDLDITDTQFSLLTGLAFTFFYTIMGIPFAWLADRGSRRNLILAAIMFWSAMTAACGMANSFLTLFLARIGVGVGEAGSVPGRILDDRRQLPTGASGARTGGLRDWCHHRRGPRLHHRRRSHPMGERGPARDVATRG